MLLQELIPSGVVLQVWRTITFRDYDSSVFKRAIQALNQVLLLNIPRSLPPGLVEGVMKQQ